MNTPTYNANNQPIWKPQPGEYFPEGLKYVNSYGGVVSAIQDVLASQGVAIKAYPKNFAGIISAIEDLIDIQGLESLPEVDDTPEGWEISAANWQDTPPDGSLWFDTRQGRLFIAIQDEFYQTNGADGVAHVGPDAPTNPPVIGQTWLDTDTGILYVYIGAGVWEGVVSDGNITVESDTLPLSSSVNSFTNTYETHVPVSLTVPNQVQTQTEYNDWTMGAVVTLDKAIAENSVNIGASSPTTNITNGTLWYDTAAEELFIYDGSQWNATSVTPAIETRLDPIEASITTETTSRQQDVTNLETSIQNLTTTESNHYSSLSNQITTLETEVDNLPVPDLTVYLTTSAFTTSETQINSRLTTLENATPDYSGLVTTAEAATESANQNTVIATKATQTDLDAVEALIPDVSNFTVQQDIDNSIAAITTNYLSLTGGTITGTLDLQKADAANTSLDFSGNNGAYSKNAFEFTAGTSSGSANTTFGTTDDDWELAWEFDSSEDFCWIHGTNGKQFSINKDGATAKNLFIADFNTNNSSGQNVANSINVGTTLAGKVSTGDNVNTLIGTTTAETVPVDGSGNDNFLFLVVNKATGALTAVDKNYQEV